MKNSIMTNELIVGFNYYQIDKDYSFFRITTSDKYIKGGASFLDVSDLSFVRSIVFETGKSFYMMTFSNKIYRGELNKALSMYEGSDTLSIEKLDAKELKENILLQLFFNSLTNSKDESLSYNNISGKFFCFKPSWIIKDNKGNLLGLTCLEIRINSDLSIRLFARKMTSLRLKNQMKFEKRKLYEYPQYEFSHNNHSLMRVTKEKLNDKNNLIQKPLEGDRGNITFFEFSNYEAFLSTKIGVLYDFIKLVKEEFASYFNLSFKNYTTCEILQCDRQNLEKYKKQVEEELLSSGINLVDNINDDFSKSYLVDLKSKIKEIFPNVKCEISNNLLKEKVNIRYIHDKTFYSDRDPYADELKDYIIQHITLENFNQNSNASIVNILKELIIKKDIKYKKITLVNWVDFNFVSDWLFIAEIDKKIYRMIIQPDGSFDISKVISNPFVKGSYDDLIDFFNKKEDKNPVRDKFLIKDSVGNINIIENTNLYTLPQFEAIGDILKEVTDDIIFKGEELHLLFEKLIDNSNDKKVIQELEKLNAIIVTNQEYDKKFIISNLKGANTKKEVANSIFENTGVRLYAYLRNKEARSEYLRGIIDINYCEVSRNKAFFAVGEIGSGMKNKIQRASVIREVKSVEGSSLVFKSLLPLMDVEFVRYGMLTVIPFPFKYLREYAKINS